MWNRYIPWRPDLRIRGGLDKGPPWLWRLLLLCAILNAGLILGDVISGNPVKIYEVVLAVGFALLALLGRPRVDHL